jgi:FtsZ-binding cell division protein ZapB
MEIIIHIGPHKTATTSIQKALSINREILEKNGIFFPNSITTLDGTHEIPWSLLHFDLRLLGGDVISMQIDKDYIGQIMETARGRGCDKIVLSSEDFSLLSIDQWTYFLNTIRSAGKDQECIDVKLIYSKRDFEPWTRSSYYLNLVLGSSKEFTNAYSELKHYLECLYLVLENLRREKQVEILEVQYIEGRNHVSDWFLSAFLELDINEIRTEVFENVTFWKEYENELKQLNRIITASKGEMNMFLWPKEHNLDSVKIRDMFLRVILTNNQLTQERDQLTQERDQLTQERDQLTQERDQLTQERDQLTQMYDAVLSSETWRVFGWYRRIREIISSR